MLNAEQNRLVTETGPGTGCGNLMRHYWQPAALTEELTNERAVVPVTLMGEELVLYRGDDGTYGLIGRHCPHRGADLCYGRLEDGGLRCPICGSDAVVDQSLAGPTRCRSVAWCDSCRNPVEVMR